MRCASNGFRRASIRLHHHIGAYLCRKSEPLSGRVRTHGKEKRRAHRQGNLCAKRSITCEKGSMACAIPNKRSRSAFPRLVRPALRFRRHRRVRPRLEKLSRLGANAQVLPVSVPQRPLARLSAKDALAHLAAHCPSRPNQLPRAGVLALEGKQDSSPRAKRLRSRACQPAFILARQGGITHTGLATSIPPNFQ